MTRPRIHNKKMLAAIHGVIIEHSGNGELADSVVEYISATPEEPGDTRASMVQGRVELLPCPFCGIVPENDKDSVAPRVTCLTAGCAIERISIAPSYWNRRVTKTSSVPNGNESSNATGVSSPKS